MNLEGSVSDAPVGYHIQHKKDWKHLSEHSTFLLLRAVRRAIRSVPSVSRRSR